MPHNIPSDVERHLLSNFEPSSAASQELTEAMEHYLAQLEAGATPEHDEFVRQYPGIAAELAACLRSLEMIHSFGSLQPSSSAADLSTNEITPLGSLGDFRIVRQIARGGMGVVYEAEQISLGRRVAVKVLPFAGMLSSHQLQRFKNEAHAAATLQHPNIVNAFFFGQERGVHFYAMRLVEGQSLADIIGGQRESNDSEENEEETAPIAALSTARTADRREFYRSVAKVGIEAAEALAYAHSLGIIHRDIKPSNILIDRDCHTWVTDFGLASTRTESDLTLTGDVLGTLRYMSPEQGLGRRGVLDHRTDIYSLGVTLYELLIQRPAFDAEARPELIRQVDEQEPRKLRSIDSAIPKDLETIIHKAMSKSVQERYGTATEMADDLDRFLHQKPIWARKTTRTARAWRWMKRNPLLSIVSTALVLALLTFAIGGPVVAFRQSELAQAAQLENYQVMTSAAYQAWQEGSLERVDQLLSAHVPRVGERDLRGFEWHHLWGRYQRTLQATGIATPGGVTCIEFSPDGRRVVAGSTDGTVRLWNVADRQMVREIAGHSQPVLNITFSPDGNSFATGAEDGAVKLWDYASLAELSIMDDHSGAISGIAFASGGELLVTSSGHGEIIYWDVADPSAPHVVNKFSAHQNSLTDVAVSPDGSLAASVSWDQSVRLWSVPGGELQHSFHDTSVLSSVEFSSDGRLLAVGGKGVIILFDTQGWRRVGRLDAGHRKIDRL